MIAWGIISITDNALDYYAPFTQFAGFLCAGAIVAAALPAESVAHSPGRSPLIDDGQPAPRGLVQ